MKYEYMLHTWGGFYNKEHQVKHGYTPGYRWFDTAEERSEYVSELKEIEQKFNARHLAISTEEGTHTRMKTIAKMVFVHQGKEYPCQYDFGFAYPPHSAEYMFFDGNYSCDCNRSLFIERAGFDFLEMGCGEEIEMKDFEVEQVLDMDYVYSDGEKS